MVCKCECEMGKNIAFEYLKEQFEHVESTKGIKKTQIKSIETTHILS